MAIAAVCTPVHSLRFLHHPQFPVLIVLALVCTGCKKDEPLQPYASSIQLKIEDASCTEVWLKVTTTEIPATMALLRDNQRVQTPRLVASDSLLIDEGLLPSHTYTYTLQKLGADSSVIESTEALQVTTMDTTSHNFTWRIDTLGVTASTLYDVAIINDTLAYAVGEMYLNDSTGQLDPILYNLVKWDGHQWELRRVTVMFRGSPVTLPLEGIFSHSPSDIWLAGSIPIHGDGSNWVGYDIQTLVGAGATVSRIWGTPNEMYFVGRAGNIIRYASGTWRRVESGTTIGFRDVTDL